MSECDVLVEEYLDQVRRAAAGIAAHRRSELIENIEEHIRSARSELDAENLESVREILERLGDPRDIASAEAVTFGTVLVGAPRLEVVEPEGGVPTSTTRSRRLIIIGVLALFAVILLVVAGAFLASPRVGKIEPINPSHSPAPSPTALGR